MWYTFITKTALATTLAASLVVASAQTHVNPATQVTWPAVSGAGTPTAGACTTNYAQPYTDTSAPHYYICTPGGWYQVDGVGGGGTVSDGTGTTTANQLAVSTTTAHTLAYAATLPTAAVPAFTGDSTNTAGSLATTVVALRNLALPTLAASTGYLYDNNGTLALQTPSGSGTVNSGTAFSPAYYPATGAAVSGTTPFAGLGYWSTTTAPAAATAAQVVGVIGATAVQNAQTSVNFSGSLAGDVTGTQAATVVGKVNGATVPASATVIGSNASSQLISQTGTISNSTTGSAASLQSLGIVAPYSTSNPPAGLTNAQDYNNGYPTQYGNVVNVYGAGINQMLLGWSGTSGANAPNYVRSERDACTGGPSCWSSWAELLDSTNYNSFAPTLTGSGASGTWAINITGTAANVTGVVAPANGGTGVANPTGYAYGNGAGNFTFSTTVPYSSLTGTPTIPTSADWPNAGSCPANEFVNALTNGATPTCASPAGSGTVNSGTAGQLAWYSAAGTAVSGNAHLDDGTTEPSAVTSTEVIRVPLLQGNSTVAPVTFTYNNTQGSATFTCETTCSIMDGEVGVLMGATNALAGNWFIVQTTFAFAGGMGNLNCQLTPGSSNSTQLQPYIASTSQNSFQVATFSGVGTSQTFSFFYHCTN